MDKLKQAHEQLRQTFSALEKSLSMYASTLHPKENDLYRFNYQDECNVYRDSVIQRFEYCIDLFWKYLKKYLEAVHVLPDIKIPGDVIRTTSSLGLITHHEAELILEMIKSRNMTSHIYVEEIADQLSSKIPGYFILLSSISTKLAPRSIRS